MYNLFQRWELRLHRGIIFPLETDIHQVMFVIYNNKIKGFIFSEHRSAIFLISA